MKFPSIDSIHKGIYDSLRIKVMNIIVLSSLMLTLSASLVKDLYAQPSGSGHQITELSYPDEAMYASSENEPIERNWNEVSVSNPNELRALLNGEYKDKSLTLDLHLDGTTTDGLVTQLKEILVLTKEHSNYIELNDIYAKLPHAELNSDTAIKKFLDKFLLTGLSMLPNYVYFEDSNPFEQSIIIPYLSSLSNKYFMVGSNPDEYTHNINGSPFVGNKLLVSTDVYAPFLSGPNGEKANVRHILPIENIIGHGTSTTIGGAGFYVAKTAYVRVWSEPDSYYESQSVDALYRVNSNVGDIPGSATFSSPDAKYTHPRYTTAIALNGVELDSSWAFVLSIDGSIGGPLGTGTSYFISTKQVSGVSPDEVLTGFTTRLPDIGIVSAGNNREVISSIPPALQITQSEFDNPTNVAGSKLEVVSNCNPYYDSSNNRTAIGFADSSGVVPPVLNAWNASMCPIGNVIPLLRDYDGTSNESIFSGTSSSAPQVTNHVLKKMIANPGMSPQEALLLVKKERSLILFSKFDDTSSFYMLPEKSVEPLQEITYSKDGNTVIAGDLLAAPWTFSQNEWTEIIKDNPWKASFATVADLTITLAPSSLPQLMVNGGGNGSAWFMQPIHNPTTTAAATFWSSAKQTYNFTNTLSTLSDPIPQLYSIIDKDGQPKVAKPMTFEPMQNVRLVEDFLLKTGYIVVIAKKITSGEEYFLAVSSTSLNSSNIPGLYQNALYSYGAKWVGIPGQSAYVLINPGNNPLVWPSTYERVFLPLIQR